MSVLVAHCPRCGAQSITFDVAAQVFRYERHGWQNWYEVFSVCRNCDKPTIFLVGLKEYKDRDAFYETGGLVKYKGSLSPFFHVDRYISLRDERLREPPEHLPKEIADCFNEGAACLAIECNNAAATMFRLCLDLVTRPLLPPPDDANTGGPQPNSRQRRDLGLRLAWLFENGKLPQELRDLAKCIREDANDGAHAGTLTKEDAEDILDFTVALLERLITEPRRLEIAEARRAERRKKAASQ